jgi:hypothetical protein
LFEETTKSHLFVFVYSVTNLMGKLKEKREAEQSPDEGKVDIRISVGNLDNAPASIILNYTKIPPIEGTS